MAPELYTIVTDLPGSRATQAQHARLAQRYQLAGLYCGGRRVLEVGCGPGIGLGYLSVKASDLIGGDYSRTLLQKAEEHYGDRIGLLQMDAEAVPFKDGSFDTVVFLEGIYYLRHVDQFLRECRRVLTDHGTVVLSTVNREWPEFNRSPYSIRYYSADELRTLLSAHGFEVEILGGFAELGDPATALLRRVAAKLHLIPKSMKGKEWLKRLFYGRLLPLPNEFQGKPPTLVFVPENLFNNEDGQDILVGLERGSTASPFTILYAVGRRRDEQMRSEGSSAQRLGYRGEEAE